MADTREVFSELFAYVLLFEQMSLQGGFQPSYEQVRHDITRLLEQQAAAARRRGMLEQDYQSARFAVVAWADETILKYTAWEHHRQWSALPLQLEYYQTRDAGEELFERLASLRADQQEIREVYYLCLGLGFSGRYFLGMEDELKLNQIRHEQARRLPLPVEEVQDVNRLTSQPYEVPPPPGRPIKTPLTQYLLKAGVAVLVAVPLVLFVVYQFSSPPKPTTPVGKPIAMSNLEAMVQRWLDDHRQLTECSKVSVVAANAQTGIVDLGGRVASETQRAEIRTGVQNIKGVTRVNDTFEIVPWPFCEVIELLEPFKQQTEAQGFGLAVGFKKGHQGSAIVAAEGTPPGYSVGENLVIEVKAPMRFESHVYVDYYDTGGNVGHLFPNAAEKKNFFGRSTSLMVGHPDSLAPWQISPPLGQDLVTVVASNLPLFSTPRPDTEPAKAYLTELRQALHSASKSAVAATFSFIAVRNQ